MKNNITARQLWLLAFLCVGFLFLFWSQSLFVPFWQDDYDFLLNAKIERLTDRSWFCAFHPNIKSYFWRPLGTGFYFRFVDSIFRADALLAHLMNVFSLVFSAIAMGCLVSIILHLRFSEVNPIFGGICAAFFYGIHGSHFLPATWACAINDSFAVLFSALALSFWILGLSDFRYRFLMVLVPVFFVLALFSREIAVVLPILGLLLTVFTYSGRKCKLNYVGWAVSISCIIIVFIWLFVHQRFTSSPLSPYKLQFGKNVVANFLGLIMFFFNVPREGIKYFLVHGLVEAFLWCAVCFLLQFTTFIVVLKLTLRKLTKRDLIILFFLFIGGCMPYFFLSWNCYAYYISFGLIAYAVLVGIFACNSSKKVLLVVFFIGFLSSSLCTMGAYHLRFPGLIARARWVDKQTGYIKHVFKDRLKSLSSKKLNVIVEDQYKFLGLGVSGLAYILNLKREDIKIISSQPLFSVNSLTLVIPAKGDVYFVGKRK